MKTVGRPVEPENRVTIANVAEWWRIRGQHDELAASSHHHLIHLMKAMGPMAAMLEHRDHGEAETPVEEKRYADLIIHAIRLAECEGHNAAQLVSNRMWQLGISPLQGELPLSERGGSS